MGGRRGVRLDGAWLGIGLAAALSLTTGGSRAQAPASASFASSWDQYQALKASAHGGSKMAWDRLPDWTGVWSRAGGLTFDASQKRGQTATASLTPQYQARYDRKLADLSKGIEHDPTAQCIPAGHPRFLTEPYSREFVLRPEETWWIQEEENEVRRIYTDGRSHVPDEEAGHEVDGDSIGFWTGDTLVVHTNHLRAGAYQKVDPDYSDQVSTVEQIRKTGPNTIQDIVDVYDPVSLRKPWHVIMTYAKVTDPPDFRIGYWDCVEGNRVTLDAQGDEKVNLDSERSPGAH